MIDDDKIAAIAAEVDAALGAERVVDPFSYRYPGIGIEDAYRVLARLRQLRESRGEIAIGRKIGFTNRTLWAEYGIYAPIWGYVFEHTAQDLAQIGGLLSLAGLSEPRIEPEIVFRLGKTPNPAMDEWALVGCIEWVAHGFEIVQSIFPGWKFSAADTIAANGLHGALAVGPRQPVSAADRKRWLEALSGFDIELRREGVLADQGQAENLLGGPLSALRHLVQVLAHDGANPPLKAGEIVSTGTLTRALPVLPGETWETRLAGIAIEGIRVTFR